MILRKEIIEKSQMWKVPPDTVDKDYVLGHFLSVFSAHYQNELIFKGGTCLRKCYIEDYRFSEDLDFTAFDESFMLDPKKLKQIAKTTEKKVGILFHVDKINKLVFQNEHKGFQVNLKYWGANHSKNQRPLPPHRWHSKIKLEVSTDEKVQLPGVVLDIFHPYSDRLFSAVKLNCYCIEEIVAEKLRALKQRSYTAPRDFYDLFHLTKDFTKEDWQGIIPIFKKKMAHKNLAYHSPNDIIDEAKIINVERAWQSSIAHQINTNAMPPASDIIETVVHRIKTYLPK